MLYATEGTKSILDGNYDDSRIFANAVKYVDSVFNYRQKQRQSRISAGAAVDCAKMFELLHADEHTLVQFYRKQIPAPVWMSSTTKSNL